MNIPENWNNKPLGTVIDDIGDGGTPNTNRSEYFGGSVPWVVIQDIKKHISSTKTSLTELGLKSCSAKLWPAGTVILSTGATIGEVGIAEVPLATKQGIHGIVCSDEVSSEFLYYKLSTLRDFLKANAQGSTIREVRAPFIRTIPISFPSDKDEQTKIATILSTLDRAIEQTEAIIAKQQRIKTGLMQDLLTKGIDEHGIIRSEATHKFKDSPLGRIPVEWEVESLKNLTSKIVDGVHHTPTYVSEGVPFITITDITAGEGISFENVRYVSPSDHTFFVKRADPRTGDVLVTKDGTLGVARIVSADYPEFSIFVSVAQIRPKDKICTPELIWSFFESGEFKDPAWRSLSWNWACPYTFRAFP